MLVGLGAFHGVNPAMGWLFAVALGLQRGHRSAVIWSLLPIAVGHALSIAAVLGVFVLLRVLLDTALLRIASALLLFAVAGYRIVRRHIGRVGMQVGFRDLVIWSFLMATAHGAGVMLIPLLLRLPLGASHAGHLHSGWQKELASSLAGGVAVVLVHTVAMLATAAVVAVAVYEWVGLAFLRRGWINFDLLWSLVLVVAGIVLLVQALF
jgi:hypothetical protein